MDYWIEWVRGPAFIFSLSFMILGLARHLALTIWEIFRTYRRAGDKSLPFRQIVQSTLQWLFPTGRIAESPFFSLTSVIFHVAILIVPCSWQVTSLCGFKARGLSWPAIPNELADVLTIMAVVAALALVLQRVAAKSTRVLSRFRDYVLPLIIALPFVLSGFMVVHPAFNPY